MIYKIVGDTSNGRASCGHRVHRGDEYYIVSENKKLKAVCKSCVKTKSYDIINIPSDLINEGDYQNCIPAK